MLSKVQTKKNHVTIFRAPKQPNVINYFIRINQQVIRKRETYT